MLPKCSVRSRRRSTRNSRAHPEQQPHRQQHLPEAPEVQVLEALVAEPRAGGPTRGCPRTRPRGCRTPPPRARPAARRRASAARAAHGRRPWAPGRCPRRGRRWTPRGWTSCTCQVRARLKGSSAGQVEAEEAGQLGAVVLRGAAQQHLQQEEHRHHQEEPRARALGGGEGHLAGAAEGDRLVLAAVPAQHVPPAEGGQQQADASQQCHEGQHAPHHHGARGAVAHPRLRGPVVGVRVVACPGAGWRPSTPSRRRRR